jgi:tetratricopeptide (TPR) repeat protein
MMSSMADLQRWSAEVARDPAAPAFLPLAQAYRRQGRTEAALQLCIRALARDPAHLDGHALLAQLYLESGDEERAGDEWSIILRLDPDHFEANRGLGFYWLERGRHADARRHLERAAARRRGDAAVAGALALLDGDSAAMGAPVEPAPAPTPISAAAPTPISAPAPTPAPGQVFGPLLDDAACLGVLLLDGQGLIRAGGLRDGVEGQVETLAALIGGVLGEASRALEQLECGAWRGLVVETNVATIRLTPFGGGLLLLLLAVPSAPTGALDRLVARAGELGEHLVEVAR